MAEEFSIVFAVAVLYFIIEPWLKSAPPFLDMYEGQIIHIWKFRIYAKHDFKLTFFRIFEYFIFIAFGEQVGAILLQPTLWTSNIVSDIFMSRVNPGNNAPNGMHVWSGLMAFGIFFVAAGLFRVDAWKAALMTVFMIFVHEGIWYIFYSIRYFSDYVQDSYGILTDAIFFITIGGVSFIYLKKYGFKDSKYLLMGIGVYTVYIFVWFLDGLPITTANNLMLANKGFNMTAMYYDLNTNIIEVVSWMLIFSVFTISLYLNKRQSTRLNKVLVESSIIAD
jgi:hypothetical protein